MLRQNRWRVRADTPPPPAWGLGPDELVGTGSDPAGYALVDGAELVVRSEVAARLLAARAPKVAPPAPAPKARGASPKPPMRAQKHSAPDPPAKTGGRGQAKGQAKGGGGRGQAKGGKGDGGKGKQHQDPKDKGAKAAKRQLTTRDNQPLQAPSQAVTTANPELLAAIAGVQATLQQQQQQLNSLRADQEAAAERADREARRVDDLSKNVEETMTQGMTPLLAMLQAQAAQLARMEDRLNAPQAPAPAGAAAPQAAVPPAAAPGTAASTAVPPTTGDPAAPHLAADPAMPPTPHLPTPLHTPIDAGTPAATPLTAKRKRDEQADADGITKNLFNESDDADISSFDDADGPDAKRCKDK